MRLSFIAAFAIFLSGCTTTKIVVQKELIPVEVPERYINCERLSKSQFPNFENLSDKQVSELLVKYETRLAACSRNMGAIRDFQKETKTSIANQKQK